MKKHHQINYLEIPAKNIAETKTFFNQVFSWEFEDYGPDYCAFSLDGIDGGFYTSELSVATANGSVLIVIYSENLEDTLKAVEDADGVIVKDIFSFPGGRRFHFSDPSGNEYAVWSE